MHNYNLNSTLVGGNGAHADADASGGGVISVENTVATSTANATVKCHVDNNALVNAAMNVGLTSLSTNEADGTATSNSGGVVSVGGVGSVVSSTGTTQAFLNSINSAVIGGNLDLLAQGTGSTTSSAQAANGGVVAVAAANASADNIPQVLASISSTNTVKAGGTVSIQALALGNANANSHGAGGGVVQVGTSRASASWQPTVNANVGAGTTLTAGHDLDIEAYNNYDVNGNENTGNSASASATATGGGLVAIDGADVTVTTNSNVQAIIGAGTNLLAGNNLNVIALSRDYLTANGQGTSGGLYAKGSVNVTSNMYSLTLAESAASPGTPTQINAGSKVNATPWVVTAPSNNITFEASANNQGVVSASGGAGGLIGQGGGLASVVLHNPLTQAGIGDSNVVDAPNALLLITATATPNLQATTTFTSGGIVANNTSDATAQVLGGQTLATIGNNVNITVDELSMLALDMCQYVSAVATANVPFSIIGSNTANSTADLHSNAQANIGYYTSIAASNNVNILAAC